ncbi:MAG: hypothetical protein WCK67_13405, partial [bacterium]
IMGFFSSVKKKISSSFKKSSKNNTKKNVKTRTLTPYNKLYPIEEENESLNKSSTPKSISIKVESKSPQTIQEFKLKFPEPLPDKINFNEKISKKMSALFNKHEDIKPFVPDALFKDIFYLYLFNKYKTKCLVATTNVNQNTIPEMRIFIKRDHPNINHERLRDIAKKLVSCISKNEPIIIFQLSLKIDVSGKTGGHANLLIYRNNTRELEHFEPHGNNFQGIDINTMILVNDVLDKDLDYLVKNMNDELIKKDLLPIKLVKAHQVCPRKLGVQAYENQSQLPKLPIEPGGYCAAWSMFFAEMCLKNPEISSKKIYKAILDEMHKQGGDDDYFKKIIRGYTSFVNNKMAKYFSEILGSEVTSAKLHSYDKQEEEKGIKPPEARDFLYKLNGLINKEVNPDSVVDIRGKDMKDITDYYNTLQKYNTFKKTIKKSTSSSDLSSKEKKSRRHTKQLKEDYDTKLSEFVKKDKEKKATEKKRKEEEEYYDDEDASKASKSKSKSKSKSSSKEKS